MTDLEVVNEFASSLDDEDYDRTAAVLAEECAYESPTGLLTGPTAIIASYADNGDKARSRFDSIVYDHRVIHVHGEWFRIEFSDELHCGNRSHTFRCQQKIQVGNGRIICIRHAEIPGQRDLLNAFMEETEAGFSAPSDPDKSGH